MSFRPWLLLPVPIAHAVTPFALKVISRISPSFQKRYATADFHYRWRNLDFRNRFGIAGGIDKNAENCLDWQRLGVGFLEVGTITPKPQGPNPGKIIDRHPPSSSLWNKMGFPNSGSEEIRDRLQKLRPSLRIPIFVNVGKNRDTSIEDSYLDYVQGFETFKDLADVFVVNISSPNTQGLRHLQNQTVLREFLSRLKDKTRHIAKPVLIKLSPDMENEEFILTVKTASEFVDGFILTNTTTQRQQTPFFPTEGGVSGKPLREIAENFLKLCISTLGERRSEFLIVGCGGVVEPQDALRRLELGADLVQTYSGLIYYGPHFFQDCCRQLKMFK